VVSSKLYACSELSLDPMTVGLARRRRSDIERDAGAGSRRVSAARCRFRWSHACGLRLVSAMVC
jgi:hypothetical protein